LALSSGRSGMHSRRTERSRLAFTLILGAGVAPTLARRGPILAKNGQLRGNHGAQFGVS
jgi:hypothetical protein